MLSRSFTAPLALLALACVALPAGAQQAVPASQMVSPSLLVTRIDTDCLVFRNAVRSETPIEVALHKESWKVVKVQTASDDVALVGKDKQSVVLAKVWRQAGHYVWAHWVARNSSGVATADQFCYRPDGTLARARQATTVAGLDAVTTREAYFRSDGSLIKKSSTFAMNDKALYKNVRNLPFFSILP
jgi:hypothetical protein